VQESAQSTAPRREDWFDPEFVRGWIERQEAKTPESRQLPRVRDAIPCDRESSFRYVNLGAGGGTLDALILTQFPHAEATLVDGSSVMVDEARSRLAPFGARAVVMQANLAEPGWAGALTGTYLGAVSTIALHNLRDPLRIRALYEEVYGLLADGGWFLNLDYTRAAGPLMGQWFQWATAGTVARPSGRGFPGTLDEQQGWLREAGFAPVDCLWRESQLALMAGFRGVPALFSAH